MVFRAVSKTVNVENIEKDCEIILIESYIETRKLFCICPYKPPSQNENNFFDDLSLVINRQTCQYERFMLIGDVNMKTLC